MHFIAMDHIRNSNLMLQHY